MMIVMSDDWLCVCVCVFWVFRVIFVIGNEIEIWWFLRFDFDCFSFVDCFGIECGLSYFTFPFCFIVVLKGGDDLNWIMMMVMREVEFCWLFFKLFIFISGKSIYVRGLSSRGGRRSFSYYFTSDGEGMFINCQFSQIPFSLSFWGLTLEIQRCVFYHQHWRSIHLSLCWISHLLNTQ